jgi:glycosyltransferase involved in cell wall biosynthesis
MLGARLKPRIVVSGVNLIEGGPLSIFKDVLEELAHYWSDRYEIVAIVHNKCLFDIANTTWLEFPLVKSSWLRRLYFEYWQCKAISQRLRPNLWLALHDMTPRVQANVRVVYCHNAAPFYRPEFHEAIKHWRFALFTAFYGLLYRVNLQRNDFVIVQQQWIRKEFQQRYRADTVIVAHPSIPNPSLPLVPKVSQQTYRLFYPAFPRSFKNFRLLLDAARILERKGIRAFEIALTIDGTESRYAAELRTEYNDLQSIRWLGSISRNCVLALYSEIDCLIFPSKLETWGMPISEFRQTGKPMLLADLPYAHETAGSYEHIHFFSPGDVAALAESLQALTEGTLHFQRTIAAPIEVPFAANWHELFDILLASKRH